MIVKTGNEYELVSRKGKNLGKYPSREGALKRERQVEYFKHLKETQMTRISFKDFIKESEQIDELSSDTLANYKKRAAAEATRLDKQRASGVLDKPTSKVFLDKANKRFSGIIKATNKQFANESEQIDELSKTKLRSYVIANGIDLTSLGRRSGLDIANKREDSHTANEKKIQKRTTGMVKAAWRLAKESVELDEAGFDWSSAARGKLQQIGEPKSNTGVHKARSYGAQDPVIDDGEKPVKPVKQSTDKKSVGRPAGTYGSYKIDKASRDDPDYKKQLSQKVMAAKAENFQIRKEFKDLMNAALKKKQAEAFQE